MDSSQTRSMPPYSPKAAPLEGTMVSASAPPLDPPAYQETDHGTTHMGFDPALGYSNQPTIVITNPPVISAAHSAPLGPRQQRLTCPNCHQSIVTEVKHKSGMKTHFVAFIMCSLGCCLCMWLPYCINACKSKHHYCPNCQTFLGTYNDVYLNAARKTYVVVK